MKVVRFIRQYLTTQLLLWLALVLAIVGSMYHLAYIFASVDGKVLLGWLQAIAIEAGLVALAYSVRTRKLAKRSTKPLWFGLALFTTISVYGNYSYGVLASGLQLPAWLAAIKPVVLAASLPILVLFIAELLSENRVYDEKEQAKQARKAAQPAAVPIAKPGQPTGKTAQRRQAVGALHSEGLQPYAILAEVGNKFGVKDVRTIKADIARISANGK